MKTTLSGNKLLAERQIQEEYDLNAVASELENLEIDLERLQARKSHLQEILGEAKKLGYSPQKDEGTIFEGPPPQPEGGVTPEGAATNEPQP